MALAIFIGLTTLLILVIFYFRMRPQRKESGLPINSLPAFDQLTPDLPLGFGYKCRWFAVQTESKTRVAEILQLGNVKDCNWQVGVQKAYQGAVFITPAIDGWTLAFGNGLMYGNDADEIDNVKDILMELSAAFGAAQFFSTHRVVEYHCWLKAVNGKMKRVYCYSGDLAGNVVVEGEPTEYERDLKLMNSFSQEAQDENYFEQDDLIWPNEELVMQIAGAWSIDPTMLGDRTGVEPELGLLVHCPVS